MPITTRNTAMTRYGVTEDVAALPTIEFEQKLRANCFHPIEDTDGDVTRIGWTGLVDINDSEFTSQTIACGNFYYFGMRIDKRSVPAATLRNEISKRFVEELKRTGKDFISRERRTEIKDITRLRLLARMPAVPKVIQCVLDSERNAIYVGTTSKTELETFDNLFFVTFGGLPIATSPSDRAVAVLGDSITDTLHAINQSERGVEFPLYCDFLLWMWYKTDTFHGGNFTLASGDYSAVVDGKVTIVELSAGNIVSQVDVKTTDEANEFADMKYGLWKFQRAVSKLNINVTRGDDEFCFSIDAAKPNSINVKTPAIRLNGESILHDGPFLEKMALLDTAQNFLDDMFTLFVKARLSNRWVTERQNITVWLEAAAPECERSFISAKMTTTSE